MTSKVSILKGNQDIDGREQVQEAQQMDEIKYQAIFENATIGIFQSTPKGQFRKVNPSMARIYGYDSPEEMIANITNISSQIYVNPSNRQEFQSLLVEFGEVLEYIGQNYRKDQSIVWTQTTARVVKDAQGNILYYEGFVTDITERKRADAVLQARLRLSQYSDSHSLGELLQKTLDEAEALTGSQIGFAHFLESNQKTLQLQMWSTNTLKNICSAEGMGGHYRVDLAGAWADCVVTRAPLIHNDYPNLPRRKGLPDGHVPVLRELVMPVMRNDLIVMIMGVGNKSTDYDDKDVETLSQLANLAWDIIQRKRVEDALRVSEALLNASQQLSKVGGWEWDIEKQRMFWTEETYRIYSFNPDEIGPDSDEHIAKGLACYDPDDRLIIFDAFQRCIEQGESYDLEFPFTNAAGRRMWIRTTAHAIREKTRIVKIIGNIMDITERKWAEEALKESEFFFKESQRAAAIGSYKADFVTDFWKTSDVLDTIFGIDKNYSRTVQSWIDIVHPDDRDMMDRYLREEVIAKRKPFSKDYRIIRKNDNETRWVHGLGEAKFDCNGKPLSLIGTILDITERKKIEDALRESKELFSLFMRHSPIYVYVKEVTPTESRILQASDNFQEMIGISSQDMIGKTVEEMFPAEFAAKITADDWAVVTSGEVLKLDEHLNDRHYTTIKFPIIQGGKTLLAGYTIDITERKLAEAKLVESESQLRNIIENEPECIKIVDSHGRLILMNPAGLAMIEADSLEQVAGRPVLDILAPEYRKGFADLHQQVLAGRAMRMEFEMLGFKGGRRWLETHAVPIQYRGETMQLAITRDVTERKSAEDELRQAKEALMEANSELQTALIREHQLAYTDALTGINNRRHLYELAEHEFEIATRYQQQLSVIMFDIDYFKEINDTFGHAAGDLMLQQVTQVACAELRSTDVIGRYGGEEFVVVLPMTNAQQAYPLAERIRKGVERIRVSTEKGDAAVTLSIGVVEIVHGAKNGSAENLIRHADKAMYTAKQAGRNRTEIGGLK